MAGVKGSYIAFGVAALGAVWLSWAAYGREAAAALAAKGADRPLAWSVPDIKSLPDNDQGRLIRQGEALLRETAARIGPHAKDPAARYAGNNLDCQSCHIDGGTRKFGLPLVGAYAKYPSYRARSGQIGTIEDRVNGCVTRSLNGRRLPEDGHEMAAIVAYLKFLSTGRAAGPHTDGQGAGHMPELIRAADPARGKSIFARQCASCHGPNGAGQPAGGGGPGYTVPPLWGPDSFNDGAGMGRLSSAANFIHNNMPNGTTWVAPALSVAAAWDVAAYIESQPRPHKAGLDRDFPKRQEKPVDTAYGPYADSFSANQHKYGPFAPIRAATAALPSRGGPTP